VIGASQAAKKTKAPARAGAFGFSCIPRASLLTGVETVKVREVIRLIETDGWFLVTTKGSHRQYKHAVKPGRVTIAGKPSDDMAPGTFNSVLKQAGLKEKK
jgi:predicted RNA binding protein YcfA (HicA-like mRNA interferase family)